MTSHKKRKKRVFKLFMICLCLVISISTLIACSNKDNRNINGNKENIPSKDSEIEGGGQTETSNRLTNIAFEKDNNAYLYNETNGQIKFLGNNLKSKDLLNISPDKRKLAFREYNEGEPIYPPHVTIYDTETETTRDIIIDNKNLQQIVDMEWIDDENILITGHINPSASGYAVYNIESGIELIYCVGTMRDVTLSERKMLYSDTPHVFPQPRANLFINGNKIFEVENDNEHIFDGVLSKDGKALAFRSWVENEDGLEDEVIAYVNIAKVNSDGKSISDLRKINIGSDTNGDIGFDDENNIIIIGDEFIYRLEEDVLIKEKNTMSKEEELDPVGLEKFKQTLAEKFPDDFISEQTLLEDVNIYNIIAF